MKRFLSIQLFVIAFLFATNLFAQQSDSISNFRKEAILLESSVLEVKPQPINKDEFDQWIKDNSRINESLLDSLQGIPPKVTVTFFVDKTGNVIAPLIWRGIGFGFDVEAARLIRENPHKWTAGMISEKPVVTQVHYQIDFKTNKNRIVTKENRKAKM